MPEPTDSAGNPLPSTTPAPYDLGNLAGPFEADNAKHWRDDGKLVMLVVGVDAGPGGGRNSRNLRYDSANLLEVDMTTGRAAMYGIPRNLHCVPLPPESAKFYPAKGGCPAGSYSGMFTAFGLEVYNNPSHFPYYQGPQDFYMRQVTAYERAVSQLSGLHVDGTFLVTLLGFVRLIDDLGGIDINVPKPVSDYPCGPSGSWQARVVGEGHSSPYGACLQGGTYSHNGYGVPENNQAAATYMKQTGVPGKQIIEWSNPGGDIAFVIHSGQQHMNGDWALAYARTRLTSDDYTRMVRQQVVLKAVRSSLTCTAASTVGRLPTRPTSCLWRPTSAKG